MLLALTLPFDGARAQQWTSLNPEGIPGTNGTVHATAVDAQGHLYAGGEFTFAGKTSAAGIAKWDGTAWSALGSGVNGKIRAIVLAGNDLYAGGTFTMAGGVPANNIAKWNGSAWSALGNGLTGQLAEVLTLSASGTNLYAGGSFVMTGGPVAARAAVWNGSTWAPMAMSDSSSAVQSIAAGNAGVFAASGTLVSRWTGTGWIVIGNFGLLGGARLRHLFLDGTDLYAGGEFDKLITAEGNLPRLNLARWDGTAWQEVGNSTNPRANALMVSGTELYCAPTVGTVRRWTGTSWAEVRGASAGPGPVLSLSAYGQRLYAGGEFNAGTGTAASRIAEWNGAQWNALGSGFNAGVLALAASGGALFAGGDFTGAGAGNVRFLARRENGTWQGLPGLASASVRALASVGSSVYVGGSFPGWAAEWNGTALLMLGGVGGGSINVIVPHQGAPCFGGQFTAASTPTATNFARRINSAWETMGYSHGYSATVTTAVEHRGEVYAAVQDSGLWRWNGTAWSRIGAINSQSSRRGVWALASLGGDLIAAGKFTGFGTVSASNIARWDGAAWRPLGSGIDEIVHALAVSGGSLYAGGAFTAAGGVPTRNLARWDGSTWSAVGPGVDGTVRALLAEPGGRLTLGGAFLHAGDAMSPFIARAELPAEIAVAGPGGSVLPRTGSVLTFASPDTGLQMQELEIRNAAAAVLELTGVSLTGPDAAQFALDTAGMALTLPAGAVTTLRVILAAGPAGVRLATLHLTSSDAALPLMTVSLVAGDAPPVLTLPTGPVMVPATSPAGGAAVFSVSASDAEDGPLVPQVAPPPGTFLPLGETVVHVTAADSRGQRTAGSFIVRVIPALEAWKHAALGDSAAPDFGDPDGDGLPNLLEYALGSPPLTPSQLPLEVQRTGGRLQMVLPRDPQRYDVTIEVQQSENLNSWSPVARSTGGAAFSVLGNGGIAGEVSGSAPRSVTISSSISITGIYPAARFLRVAVSR